MLVACSSSASSVKSAASYVPWIPLPAGYADTNAPGPGTPPPVPAGTPFCQASQLEGTLIGRYSAMSNLDAPIELRNKIASPCYLSGYAGVTILDSAGHVMAAISGSDGRGTYFDSTDPTTVVKVLMEPGTEPLDNAVGWGGGTGLPPGQAFLNIEWAGCTTRSASQVYLDLPDGAGRVAIPFAVVPNGPDVCSRVLPVTRGPFDPTGISWPPDRQLIKIAITLSTPQPQARRGSTLTYFVTLENTSREDYRLTPCPDYWETVSALKTASVFYQLNCAPSGTVAAGASVTFEMKLAIPDDAPQGSTTLLWHLTDGRILADDAQAPITIT